MALGLPVPWMMGPLLATALATLAGAPTHSEAALRNAGQWAIGAALGLYFTPEVTRLVLSLWWAVALGIGWALLLGLGFGLVLRGARGADLQGWSAAETRATMYFSGAVGGASEMTLLAERCGARTDLVAAAHSVRMAMVVLSVPLAMQWAKQQWQLQALDVAPPAHGGRRQPVVHRPAAGGDGFDDGRCEPVQRADGADQRGATGHRRQPGRALHAPFLQAAPRWLAAAALGTLAMIGASALFGAALAWASGLHPVTLMLDTAPGGIAEMAITAKVLQLGVAVVTAFQVCPLVAVLLLAEPIYRRWVMPRE